MPLDVAVTEARGQSPQRTLRDLTYSTARLRPSVKDTGRLYNVTVTPSWQTKSMVVRAGFDPRSYGQPPYAVVIVFFSVKMADQAKAPDFPLAGKDAATGKSIGVERLSTTRHKVQVRCSCKDFQYTWHYYDKRNAALSGAVWPPYVRKTPPPPTGRPYANPLKVPGFCKHLARLVGYLISSNIIR